MTRFASAVLAALLLWPAVVFAADPVTLPGRVDAVTVYLGQALVTRVVDVPGPAGLRDVVVTDLPDKVIPGSLYAEAGADVEVRAVSYRDRPVEKDVRADVAKLDADVQTATDQLATIARQKQVSTERGAYLNKLQDFVAATANAELTRGVLNAETLKSLTTFVFDQRQTLADTDLKLARDEKGVDDQLALLRRRQVELSAGAVKSVREAVVLANYKGAGGQFRLNYLVDSAGWSPSYVARAAPANAGKRPVALRYNATIQQTSGEAWSDVVMTLSTATPSMVASAPTLDPLAITLAARADGGLLALDDYAAQKSLLTARRRQSESMRAANTMAGNAQAASSFANVGPAAPAAADSELNSVADQLQTLELVTKDARRGGRPLDPSEGLSVTYRLPGRTSMPSRDEQQSIQIANLDLNGDFYKLAMPVLTSYVYDQATVTNETKLVLLSGAVASYTDDQYVGAGTLPTVAVGQQFTLGFGIDPSLRATRELQDKTDVTQGGNRVLNFTFKLAIENFGSAPATVRLTDRLPTSKNQDLKVTSDTTAHPATAQVPGPAAVGSTAKRAGILNWSVDVPAQAIGDKAYTLDYSYKLEFDKTLSIAGLPTAK